MKTSYLAPSVKWITLCVLFVLVSHISLANAAQPSSLYLFRTSDTVTLSGVIPDNVNYILARSLPAPPQLPETIQASFQPISPFSSVSVSDLSVSNLTQTKFVVAYRALLGGAQGTVGAARVGQVMGGVIVYGPMVIFNPALTTAISIATLSSAQFVVTYRDHDNSDYGVAVIGNVSGDTITFGSEYIFNYAATHETSVAFLGAGGIVIAFQDTGNSSHGKAVKGAYDFSASGNVITFSDKFTFNAETTSSLSIKSFYTNGSYFIVAYRDASNGGRLKFGTYEISTGSIIYSDQANFNGFTGDISVAGLTGNKAVVVYRDEGNLSHGAARIVDIRLGYVTLGGEYTFCTESTYLANNFGVDRLSDNSFVIGYFGAGADGRIIIASADASHQITYGPELSYNPGFASYRPVVAGMSGELVCWSDLSAGNIGKCRMYGDWISIYLPLVKR